MRSENLGALELRRLARDIGAELEVMDALAGEVGRVAARPTQLGPEAEALLALRLHGWYTALEALLERVARTVEGSMPVGPAYHRDLLRGMTLPLPEVRPVVLRSDLLIDLADLLAFRHFLRHAYAVPLDEGLLRRHAARLARIAPLVREDLETFAQVSLDWAAEFTRD